MDNVYCIAFSVACFCFGFAAYALVAAGSRASRDELDEAFERGEKK